MTWRPGGDARRRRRLTEILSHAALAALLAALRGMTGFGGQSRDRFELC